MTGKLCRNTLNCIVTRELRLGCWVYRDTPGDMAAVSCDTALQRARGCCNTTDPGHDTAGPSLRYGTTIRRSVSGLGAQAGQAVHLVHPTQVWTQCTVSVTVWDTVHEHCSQNFFEKKKK